MTAIASVFLLAGGIYVYANHLFFWGATAAESPSSTLANRITDAEEIGPPQPEEAAEAVAAVEDSSSEQPGEEKPVSEEVEETDATGETENTAEKILALTFDDGPSVTTQRLVEGLNERGVKATFFMLGTLVERYPEVVDFVYASGNQIVSHGWDHKHKFTELSDEALQTELENAASAVRGITGEDPLYVRPPCGAIDKVTAAKIDVPVMLWNIDPSDWESRNAEAVCDAIINGAFHGGVIILHDMYDSTVDGVLAAIDILQAEGWRFVTLEKYYEIFEITPEAGLVYRGTRPADYY